MESPRPRGKRRVRVACDPCKQKKQKCDGQTPACGNCVKNRRDCIVQDPSTKRSLPPGYVSTLEARVAYLEGLLKGDQRAVAMDHMDEDTTSLLATDSSHTQATRATDTAISVPSDKPTTSSTNFLDSCSRPEVDTSYTSPSVQSGTDCHTSPLEMLCMNSAAGQSLYFGASSPLLLSRSINAMLRGVHSLAPGLSMAGVDNELLSELPRPCPVLLPGRFFCDILANSYFTHVHPQFPFIHRPTYDKWQRNVLDAIESAIPPDPMQVFFVYMINAIGSLVLSGCSPCSAEGLYASAENLFENVMKTPRVESIQAILCYAMYSMRSTTGVSVWMLSGLALRQCIELGLHRKTVWKRESDVLRSEMRRRVFWVAYNLDRAAAFTLGRPLGIFDGDIDVEFPTDINDEGITPTGFKCESRRHHTEPATTVSGAVHTIRLRKIWGQIQSLIYPTQESSFPTVDIQEKVAELRRKLQQWYDERPKWSPGASMLNFNTFGSDEWFSLSYHHSVLLLHRRRLVTKTDSEDSSFEGIDNVYLECVDSVASLCKTYRQIYLSTTVSTTWGALHVLFLGGLTFLHCLWASKKVREAYRRDTVTSICTSCTVVLVVMAERWPAAVPYRETFEALVASTQSMLVKEDLSLTAPSLPALWTTERHHIAEHLSRIEQVGMCDSVERLLNEVVG